MPQQLQIPCTCCQRDSFMRLPWGFDSKQCPEIFIDLFLESTLEGVPHQQLSKHSQVQEHDDLESLQSLCLPPPSHWVGRAFPHSRTSAPRDHFLSNKTANKTWPLPPRRPLEPTPLQKPRILSPTSRLPAEAPAGEGVLCTL